jgi:hypothetical protein
MSNVVNIQDFFVADESEDILTLCDTCDGDDGDTYHSYLSHGPEGFDLNMVTNNSHVRQSVSFDSFDDFLTFVGIMS